MHSLTLGRRDEGFPGSDGLIPHSKREPVARHLNRNIGGGNVEDDQHLSLVFNQEADRLRRIQ